MARILLVDDEHNVRLMVRLALQHVGHTVVSAGDGEEALERFADGAGWDLVLLDHRMPGMPGVDVLREMRRRDPAARVVMVTAFGTVDLALEAMRGGAADFIRKPFTVETLRAGVAAALEGPDRAGSAARRSASGFASTTLNGFRIEPASDLAAGPEGDVRLACAVRSPSGSAHQCEVRVSAPVVRGIAHYGGGHVPPRGSPFWTSLCEEMLANHLWQHAEVPAGGVLAVTDLTAGVRRWMDAVLGADGRRDADGC